MTEYLLGIDIGATNTRLAVLDTTGTIITAQHRASQMELGEEFFRSLAQQAKQLADEYQAQAIGVGTAGQIERSTGTYLPGLYPKAPWVGVPLRDIIRETTKLPTFVDNDCKISAYAELKVGQGQNKQDFVSLTLGTGLGGGIISNGELVHGKAGIAGHLGHISIAPDGPKCACGTRGCLELFASGTAIANQGSAIFQKKITSPEVFELASQGNQKALTIVQGMGTALGHGLGIMANILNPELFILGGSILTWYPLLQDKVEASFGEYAMDGLQMTKIVRSQLEGQGGIIGAALYARDQLQS